jgi:glycosyltransferase involved in cell wall biosynthesis
VGRVSVGEEIFSIVTVVKDDVEGLQRTRQSLERQDVSNWEHIVVVASPHDLCLDLVRTYPSPQTRLVIQIDRGIYSAMNKGWKTARARYVLFLNAGDELSSRDSLSQVQGALCSSEAEWAVFGGVVRSEHSDTQVRPLSNATARDIGFGVAGFMHPSIYYRRDLLTKLGGYNTQFEVAGDLELNLRAFKLCSPKVADISTSIFYIGGVSTTRIFTSIFESGVARTASMAHYPLWVFENYLRIGWQVARALLGRVLHRSPKGSGK